MDFFEGMEKTIPAAANLAMKKLELDIANQRWQDQLAETKRQHQLNAGLKLLETGDYGNAGMFLKSALPELNTDTLTQSPLSKLKQAQTEDALRRLDAQKKIVADVQALMAPQTETRYLGRNPEMSPDEATPTETITTPGKEVTPKDYLNILMKHDPESAATLKALTTQTGLESAKEKLEWMYKMLESKERLGQDANNARMLMAIAAMTRANKAGGDNDKKLPPSYDKAIDNAISQQYLADPIIGPVLNKKLAQAKIADPTIDAFRVMEPHQQEAALRIKEYATEELQTGRAKTSQSAVKAGRERFLREVGKAQPVGGPTSAKPPGAIRTAEDYLSAKGIK